MTAPSSVPSSTSSRPNRAERRAAARGKAPAEHAGVPAPRVTGHVRTKPRGGAVGAPRRTG